jgi:hypothetical protein
MRIRNFFDLDPGWKNSYLGSTPRSATLTCGRSLKMLDFLDFKPFAG